MQTSRDARRDPSATWHATRARILARAGNRCEQCQVANGDDIVRGIEKDVGTFQRLEGDGEVFAADDGRLLGYCKASEYCGCRWTRIVLTVVRFDGAHEHASDDNLKALCQRCRLEHDAEHRRAKAAATRRARKAIGDLFDPQTTGGNE
ncbi:hypothetical protein WS98_21565 [Burkholderia territorii]|uniref:hypothetical protein n=1 Tax=Burkholderia territorii TaxID=1503055 RepID=UPI00075980EC|nr:hypothetical protein [Burkholderia territorii]KUY96871.1 hypothetical protein WS47_07240 [Burkholderia territorii]KUZ16410.1 hypothetical protein WS50_15300 [Burkholderia territorii]KVL32131.1 hypothetical protein WS98_21565 [Burkholderia territorii]KWA08154.1 hypothetical protein WT37_26180 [Burkholderia territorii]